MRKFVSLLTALSMAAAGSAAVMAADRSKNEPDVVVDKSKIIFEDQNAVIVDGITLVPARGVFSAMGCEVVWNEEARTVKVTSATGVRYVLITIDSDIMQICTYKSILAREDVDYTLEVPAQIINDRTMIPLRAVSEAFDCEVEWDDENYTVNITTGEDLRLESAGLVPGSSTATAAPTAAPSTSATTAPGATASPAATATAAPANGTSVSSDNPSTPDEEATAQPVDSDNSSATAAPAATEIPDASKVSMSLSTDATGELKAGDTFTVYVDIDNFPDNAYLNGLVATFEFDQTKFEYVEGNAVGDGDTAFVTAGLEQNAKHTVGAKIVYSVISADNARTTNGHVYKATFRSVTGESGTIALNNDFNNILGYNSYATFFDNSTRKDLTFEGKTLNLDVIGITIGK